jgi:hypothetical protein
VAAAGVALAVGVTILVTRSFGGAQSQAGTPHKTPQTSLATVTARSLSSQLNASGTLRYAGSYTVVNHAQGAFTALPGAGQAFAQGQVLYRVANQPVVLLDGRTPRTGRWLKELPGATSEN